MQVNHKWQRVTIYSITHFLVDFACAFYLFRTISSTPEWSLCVLLYNFCAFAMQMPLGILADKWNRNALFAAIGCALVAAAYGLSPVPVVAAVVAGLGNGMFHVGGGVDVLNISEEKSGALGVFVSPGAFGIYFGTLLGKGDKLSAPFVLAALLVTAGLILCARYLARGEAHPSNAPFSLDGAFTRGIPLALICLFLVVCLRSYVGLTLNFPWKSGGWAMALICAVVLGKTAGGFLADRLGAVRATLLSLGLAAVLFFFSGIPPVGVAAVLLFNMTMPITLWAMARILPGAMGFSFGLLTFALFLGFLPVYMGSRFTAFMPWLFGLCAAASLVLLWQGLRRARL